MTIEQINPTTKAIQFIDSNGWRQTVKVVSDSEGVHIGLPENWLTLADVELWMQALQLAKTLA